MTPATFVRGLIDTPVLIDYRNGEPGAIVLMIALRQLGLPDISQLSAMVLIARCQDAADKSNIDVFHSISTIHAVTAWTTRRAIQILHRLTPPCGLTADDAIVAATAIEQKLPLYTLNPTQFAAIPGLVANRPY